MKTAHAVIDGHESYSSAPTGKTNPFPDGKIVHILLWGITTIDNPAPRHHVPQTPEC
jgi:hypothetical protein